MVKLLNLVKVNIATTGTGTVTFGSAFSNAFFTPSEAGAADGDSVSYVLVEGDDTEIGTGVIGSSVTTMTRTVIKSKIGGVAGTTKMTLAGTAWLAFTALDRDISVPANNLSDVASVTTSRNNLGAFGKIVVQKFTASGTYTPSANLIYAQIECVGGGGGGGGATASTSVSTAAAGGGGGAYARKVATAAAIGVSQTVTIGNAGSGGAAGATGSSGGDTSVGTLCVAKGGSGGGGANGGFGNNGGAGGIGSTSTGDVTVDGNGGGVGASSNQTGFQVGGGGEGGGSYFGGGARGLTYSGAGPSASANTGGGGGGATVQGSGSNSGGNGGSGLVVITEYCSS